MIWVHLPPQHSCLGPLRLSKSSKVQFQVQIQVQALLERRRLGKGGYRYVAKHFRPHGLVLPSYPEVAALRSTLVCLPLQLYLKGPPEGRDSPE